MRIGKGYLRMAGGIAWVLGSVGCQTAPRPVALLPAKQASAPAISASAPAAARPAAEAPPAPIVTPQREVKADPAADLVAQVEKEYQAGQANYQA